MYSGSPARSRCAPTSTCPIPASTTPSARRRHLAAAVEPPTRVVLSLAHNMAQTNQITAALSDVLTEFVNDNDHAEEAQKRLAEAVDNVR